MTITGLADDIKSRQRFFRTARPILIDLFCGAGGAAQGYYQAGFEVVGIDINPQPRYPFHFIQGDVLDISPCVIAQFDAAHASPPCQRYSKAQRLQRREHPDHIGIVREKLLAADVPYAIENVPGAPLVDPYTLCGAMFPELRVYRHRQFELNFPHWRMAEPEHVHPQCKMGRPPKDGEFIHVVGNFSGADYARAAMGIDWMTKNELRESIPPAFTKHIGEQLRAYLEERIAA